MIPFEECISEDEYGRITKYIKVPATDLYDLYRRDFSEWKFDCRVSDHFMDGFLKHTKNKIYYYNK